MITSKDLRSSVSYSLIPTDNEEIAERHPGIFERLWSLESAWIEHQKWTYQSSITKCNGLIAMC